MPTEYKIRNAQGDIIGGWGKLPNGDEYGWYTPYMPLMVHRPPVTPDYLAITRDVVECADGHRTR
jgi:hypothetical protein